MSIGWIRLHRKIMDNDEYLGHEFDPMRAWIDLLMLARHEDGIMVLRGIRIPLKRGQVGWSKQALGKRWKWSRGKVRRFFERKIKQSKMIQQTVHVDGQVKEPENEQQNKYLTTIITITNYEQYQQSEHQSEAQDGHQNGQQNGQQTDSKRTADGTRIKNGKNGNNEKKEERPTKSSRVYCSQDDEFKLASLLFTLMQKRNDKHKIPDMQKWSKSMGLLIGDGNRPSQIDKVIRWVQADSFWQNNILSPSKLRDKYPRLWEEAGKPKAGEGREVMI
ncbi:MAG: hypothetical protein GY782_04870 [Gammaproteobacteria bacterium]|nr:hypothetical protein [Gammaproteobacteria bacterium]